MTKIGSCIKVDSIVMLNLIMGVKVEFSHVKSYRCFTKCFMRVSILLQNENCILIINDNLHQVAKRIDMLIHILCSYKRNTRLKHISDTKTFSDNAIPQMYANLAKHQLTNLRQFLRLFVKLVWYYELI